MDNANRLKSLKAATERPTTLTLAGIQTGVADMKLQVTSRRPCELERGQARRVPQNPRGALVGYHVCCPRCGYVIVALHGSDGLTITESDDRTVVTFSTPLRCLLCKVRITVSAGELQLVEDEHVKNVRYR